MLGMQLSYIEVELNMIQSTEPLSFAHILLLINTAGPPRTHKLLCLTLPAFQCGLERMYTPWHLAERTGHAAAAVRAALPLAEAPLTALIAATVVGAAPAPGAPSGANTTDALVEAPLAW